MDLGLIASVASPAVAVLALVVALLARQDSRRSARAGQASAEAAQRSADAAERATALLERDAAERRADRHEADGPEFRPMEEAVLSDDLTARVKLEVVGGPGELDVEMHTDDELWCEVLSSIGASAVGSVLSPGHESGDVIPLYVHLAVRPWAHDDPVVVPITVEARTKDLRRRWRRRVSVKIVPSAPTPLAVPPDPDRPPLPRSW